MLEDDDFVLGEIGTLEDWENELTNDRIADELLAYICPAGEPWTVDTPWNDHGHTKCMWIGMAYKRLKGMT